MRKGGRGGEGEVAHPVLDMHGSTAAVKRRTSAQLAEFFDVAACPADPAPPCLCPQPHVAVCEESKDSVRCGPAVLLGFSAVRP